MNAFVVGLGAAWGAIVATPLFRRAVGHAARCRGVALTTARGRASRRLRPGWPSRARRHRYGFGAPLAALRARSRSRTRQRELERAVPLALDVLTVASRAGCTPRLALAATARWSVGALHDALAGVEGRCRLGSSLADSLDELARAEPALRSVAEALAVAERSGAPTADLLVRLSDEARASLRRRAEAHARRVPVRLLFPLVFLVLPAFGLLTVVPALLAGLRSV